MSKQLLLPGMDTEEVNDAQGGERKGPPPYAPYTPPKDKSAGERPYAPGIPKRSKGGPPAFRRKPR